MTPKQADSIIEFFFNLNMKNVKKWWNNRGMKEMRHHSVNPDLNDFWDESWKNLTYKDKLTLASLITLDKI